MRAVLVDSNVLIDVLTRDPAWFEWSSRALSRCGDSSALVINPIIYAEVSVGFDRIEDLDTALPERYFRRAAIPWEAGFLAGKCFETYRRREGNKRSPLPDFYIGAHAAVAGLALLTRDASRYRSYFRGIELITPERH
ncbi:MAG: type II toxin-antitoxin system VapC family toxin [Polyangia bacterium]